ncbi:MAG: PAS domain S-box protein [Hyphomicrobiales bacterium]|nr:MAG: PAS domain S-box protein [Hyphomicrobiales bacterium]
MLESLALGGSAADTLKAIGKSLAIIEFDSTGTIRWANENFCKTLGYSLAEIQGRHHSMFCEPAYVNNPDYKAFWAKLGRGEFDAAEYKRIGAGGKEVWIQASYNPVVSKSGKVKKVVKIATDITQAKLKSSEDAGKITAINRAQAVIEFTTDGTVLDANENFLKTLGYRLDEIKGRQHRMFVDAAYANSPEYSRFWERLRAGEFIADEFPRVGKGGKEVWIQASYNPIFDMNGKVVKVVKFATDVTDRVRAVGVLADGLSSMASGDLQLEITTQFPPALEKLRIDFNATVSKLKETILSVVSSTGSINASTREITTAADDLSKRTEQQAASLEETAAALDEITATGKKAAEGANHARDVVSTAQRDAEKTGVVVRKTVDAMGGIEKSAQQINQIIGVIDEIAFQTNLLAINAGVEAARAGDAGRGFAVVASEVRALAQRSADAAKEIKGLISTSSAQVAEGVQLVAETGKALERILEQVNDINKVVVDIAAGAQEQATGLSQVNTAINQMDQATQQNAAMVEQSTAAGHSLAHEAAQLATLVSQFQVGHAAAAPPARKAPAASVHRAIAKPKSAPSRVTSAAVRKPEPAEAEADWQDF